MKTTLDQLIENESGIIKKIHDEELAIQMLTMGFILGEKIKVERIAPLKDPILITSGTNYISIRKTDAKNIEINNCMYSALENISFKGRLIFTSSTQEELETFYGKAKKEARIKFKFTELSPRFRLTKMVGTSSIL